MARLDSVPAAPPEPTLPRLRAVDKSVAELDDRLSIAANGARLPPNWDAIEDESELSSALRHVHPARADYVLRWVLDKLSGEDTHGEQARANPRAWRLAECAITASSVGECASHLKEAGVLTILERALHENFDKPLLSSADSSASHAEDASESSGTAQQVPKSSRKRKRPSSGAGAPAKKLALPQRSPHQLFTAVARVVKSVDDKANACVELGQKMHMRLVLSVEAPQAARILKHWLTAVSKLLQTSSLDFTDHCCSLSLAADIWDKRSLDQSYHAEASAELFSAECLIPSLLLRDTLQRADLPSNQQTTLDPRKNAIRIVDRLLVVHLLLPAQTAFLASDPATPHPMTVPKFTAAEHLVSNLEPLRAKIEQAAEVHDTSGQMPTVFEPFFRAIPELLDMVIKISLPTTLQGRRRETSWLQAVFVALTECAGCPFATLACPVLKDSTQAVERCLELLAVKGVSIHTDILEDLFWFHSGMNSPIRHRKMVRWPLVAAIIKLDPSIFLLKPTATSSRHESRPRDLSKMLFDEMSSVPSVPLDTTVPASQQHELVGLPGFVPSQYSTMRQALLESVVIPVLSAFVRNRDLLGFFSRWDDQLCQNASIVKTKLNGIDVGAETSLWEDDRLVLAVQGVVEQSLTQGQLIDLFSQHGARVKSGMKAVKKFQDQDSRSKKHVRAYENLCSSSVILFALLTSVGRDELIVALEPQLKSLLKSYSSLVRKKSYRHWTDVHLSWTILLHLVILLWPIELHGSSEMQHKHLDTIIEQALKDQDRQICKETLLFLLTVCDKLRTVPGWDGVIKKSMKTLLLSLTSTQSKIAGLDIVVETLFTRFSALFEIIEPDVRDKTFFFALNCVNDGGHADEVLSAMSESLSSVAIPSVRDAYVRALSTALDQFQDHVEMSNAVHKAILRIPPTTLSRAQREATLEKLANATLNKRAKCRHGVDLSLAVMIHLMRIPNATAMMSRDPQLLFGFATKVLNFEFSIDQNSLSTVYLVQELVSLTLDQILKNKEQQQNAKYLEDVRSILKEVIKKPETCSTPDLIILRAVMKTPKGGEILSWEDYSAFLTSCPVYSSVRLDDLLDSWNHMPESIPYERADILTSYKDSLETKLNTEVDVQNSFHSWRTTSSTPLPIATWVRLHRVISRFRFFNPPFFFELTMQLLRQDLSEKEEHDVLDSVKGLVNGLEFDVKVGYFKELLTGDLTSASLRFLHVAITTLTNDEAKQRHSRLHGVLLSLLDKRPEAIDNFNVLMDIYDFILREKSALLSQHGVEHIVGWLSSMVCDTTQPICGKGLPAARADIIYGRLCETTRLILLLHRHRVGGRFHLLLPLLETLLKCLFIPNENRGRKDYPPWMKTWSHLEVVRLKPHNGAQFARLLSTLCSPSLSSVSKSAASHTQKSLNDPVKAAKDYASHFLYPLLSSFCKYQLQGALHPSHREKLMPGIWEMVNVASLDWEGLQAMHVGLDKASAAVWKGVWEEWRRVGGAGGGAGGKERK